MAEVIDFSVEKFTDVSVISGIKDTVAANANVDIKEGTNVYFNASRRY